jgi:hypothetical protein
MKLVRRRRSVVPQGQELRPLPRTTAWPEATPLDLDIATSALWHAKGNVGRAATLIGTDTARLGYLISRTPDLQDTRRKASELMLDAAEGALLDGLDDEDARLDAAKWILTQGGRGRGWGQQAAAGIGFSFDGALPGAGQIAIKWQVADE